jgi:hypothetical protein
MTITLNGTTGEIPATWTTATRPASPSTGQTGFNTTTTQMETYNGSAWTSYSAATTQGTSGQYLQSAGAGAAPTWATISSTGSLARAPQIITSGTTYTTPATANSLYIQMWSGGGGGGGGCSGNAQTGSGGGNGAYLEKYVSVSPSTTYTIAVGAGGTGGGQNNNGTSAGTTSITISGTTYSCGGGGGGFNKNGGTVVNGTPSNGDFQSNAPGGALATSNYTYSSYAFGGPTSTGSGSSGRPGVMRIWEYT